MNLARIYTTTGTYIGAAATDQNIRELIDMTLGADAVLKADWTIWRDGKLIAEIKWETEK